MKQPYTLLPDTVSKDTVRCLETLLEHARSGAVIGVAYAAVLRQRNFIVSAAGEAHRSPTFARGMVAALDDKLSERIRGDNP